MGRIGQTSAVSRRLCSVDCSGIPALLGHTIALTGDRRSDELAAYLRIRGGDVLHGPVLRMRPVPDDDGGLRRATTTVLTDPPDYLLATTGIGIRGWLNAAETWHARDQLVEALGSARVLARGPKVVGSLSEAGLTPWFVARSGRTSTMVDHLTAAPLRGVHVAVQFPADAMHAAVDALRQAGARVTVIPVYEAHPPEDMEPARRVLRAVVDGRVSAVTFTSRRAVQEFWSLAGAEDLQLAVARALHRQVVPACIGSATGEVLHDLTGVTPCTPDHSVLGALGRAVADRLRTVGHHHVGVAGGRDVVVQGRLVDGRGTSVMTSDREAAVLGLLIGPPVRTVSRSEIFRSVWHREAVSMSILDNTVVRLRRRIAGTGLAIRTVHGRGYLVEGTLRACAGGGSAARSARRASPASSAPETMARTTA